MKKITRRSFISGLASTASSAAIFSITGCGIEEVDNKPMTDLDSITDGSLYFPQSVASGDPKTDSVILWTRVADSDAAGEMLKIRFQMATDEGFENRVADQILGALPADDGCLKLRIAGLSADTRFYYRFLYDKNDAYFTSRTGRTRTAPALTSSREVKFAYVSCQDYVGRYYNTYLKLLDEDLDFIVHLGDYIYETTGDPSFQNATDDRKITFSDSEGAILRGEGENTYYAASSLSNYRELYKTYRSDPVLQQVHERFPMVAVWDDHEFSDDSYGSTSTMTAGKQQEQNDQRKRNAEQAYFEFMPVDALSSGSTTLPVLQSQLYPNTRIYRDFQFGQNLHLVMTDFRTYRPDHLIPEDGFPGTVVMNRFEMTLALSAVGIPYEAVAAKFTPYLDIDSENFAAYKPVLLGVMNQAYLEQGLDSEAANQKAMDVIQGDLAAQVVNGLLATYNAAVPESMQVPLIADEVLATLDSGIAYMTLGKSQLFSSIGSRYFVTKDVYDLYASYKYQLSPSSQNAYGAAQEYWYKQTLLSSPARWKVVASSVSHTSLVLDLTNPALGVPSPFNQKFYLNLDHWDGFANKRDELLNDTLAHVNGSVLIAGDIHASFVASHPQGTHEFTNTSVSSGVFRDLLAGVAATDPVLSQIPGIQQLVMNDGVLMQMANPSIAYANTNVNGVAIVTASAESMQVSLYEAEHDAVFTSAYDEAEAFVAAMTEKRYLIDQSGQLSEVAVNIG